MKMLKKLFGRLTAQHDATPPVRPDPTPESIFGPITKALPQYQQDQRDFRRRAKAVVMFWSGSTYVRPEPKPKRPGRARRTRLAQERAA